jgi:NADPH-dependent curcumin reductase CurA
LADPINKQQITITMTSQNKEVLFVSRPNPNVSLENFKVQETSSPSVSELKEGEVLIQLLYISVDPYMRMRMNTGKVSFTC